MSLTTVNLFQTTKLNFFMNTTYAMSENLDSSVTGQRRQILV